MNLVVHHIFARNDGQERCIIRCVAAERRDIMSHGTSTSSRKRKVDALEFADDGSASSPSRRKLKVADATTSAAHLPAPCLAAILNFMEYADVRRCLLAGTIMAVDAARHVEVLNIMNASELVPSAARRFANVTEVNILSLLDTDEDGDEDTLSVGTASRSVLFLASFPKLKRAYLGGLWGNSKFSYSHHSCQEPKDHLSVFRGLVDHLCGAFRSRSLSPSLHLEGVFDDQLDCYDGEREDGHRCRYCWNIFTSFPPALVLGKIPERHSMCLSYSERIEALATRHDNPLRFQPQAVVKCFLAMTKAMLSAGNVDSGRDFIGRMKSQGGKLTSFLWSAGIGHGVEFYYVSIRDMWVLKKFSTAIGPSVMNAVPKRELLSTLHPLGKVAKDGKKSVLVRQTFESLVQLGFDLASKDYVLFDPLNEDALDDYHHLFRSRSEEEAS